MMILIIIVATVCLLSMLCSLAEASIVGLNDFKARNLNKQNVSGAKHLLVIIENRSKYLSTVIFLNTLVNVGGSMFVGSVAATQFDEFYYAVFVAALTFVMLIFSEVKPKVYATSRPERVGRFIAKPLIAISWLLTPVVAIISSFIGHKEDRESLNLHEVRHVLASAGDTGVINKDEAHIAQNLFNLRDRKSKELVIKDGTITSIPVHETIENAKELALKTNHKRIIAVNQHNQPVGVVLQRDILKSLVNEDCEEISIAELIHPVKTVDEDCCLSQLILKLYRSDTHLAVVVNDDQQMVGVISLSNVQELLLT